MGILDGLKGLFAGGAGGPGSGSADGNAYWVYVQCAKCGEALKVRVDRRYDLMQEFGDGERVAGYSLHKDIMGSGRCFQMIRVDQELDAGYRIKKQQISNGRFLTPAEYETMAK